MQCSREVNDKCNILNWNYTLLSTKSYGEALDYINTNPLPNQISCKSVDGYYFYYDSKDILDSFVAQVNDFNEGLQRRSCDDGCLLRLLYL